MIEQRPVGPDGQSGLWDTEEPGYVDRGRVWHAIVGAPGQSVIVRHMPVLADGEDWTGYPPTYELTWREWQHQHAQVYGMTIDGVPQEQAVADRSAWQCLRRAATGEVPVDADFAEATLRILRGLGREVTE